MRATKGVVVLFALFVGVVSAVGAEQPGEAGGPSATATCGNRAIQPSEVYAGYKCPLGNNLCGSKENIQFSVGTFPYVLQGCEQIIWLFGEGGAAAVGPDPIFAYQKQGQYTVSVIISNGIAPAAVTKFTINIVRDGAPAPGVDFAWVPFNPVVNTTVTFSAAASAGGTASDWTWDFGDGSSGTGQVVTHAYAAAGNYLVKVTGQSDNGPSASQRYIRVAAECVPVQITSQPVSVTVDPSSPAQFDVVADGTGLLRYQWYEGTTGDTSHPVVGANGSTLLVLNVTKETSYWVRVSNECGTADSDTVAVTINSACVPPVFTSQTLSAMVETNFATTLHARAVGMLPITYRWWAGGVENPIQKGQTFVTAPLSTSTMFYAVATNPCGSTMSRLIDVRVGPPRRHPANRPN